MIEFALLTLVIFLFLNRKKKKRKPRTLDGQLQELITQSTDATSIAVDIKRYLLNTINDNNNDNGLPTNVEEKLGSSATPQAVVEAVVKI